MSTTPLIRVSNLPEAFSDMNGLFVMLGEGYYSRSTYYLLYDSLAQRWYITSEDGILSCYSAQCLITDSPELVEWTDNPVMTSITLIEGFGSNTDGTYTRNGGQYYCSARDAYLQWNESESRWELFDTYYNVVAYDEGGTRFNLGSKWYNAEFSTELTEASLSCTWEYNTPTLVSEMLSISTAEEFAAINTNEYSLAATYRQTANIDFAGIPYLVPIGIYVGGEFTGTYDGGNYEIQNLTLNHPSTDYIGLFGICKGAFQIKNIKLTSPNMTGKSMVGGLVGYASGVTTGKVSNCHATNVTISSAGQSAGGLIGQIARYNNGVTAGDETVKDCSVVGGTVASTMASGVHYGGFVGAAMAETVRCSCAGLTVTAAATGYRMGGFAGILQSGRTVNCYCRGMTLSGGNGTEKGSFAGRAANDVRTPVLTNCYAVSNVNNFLGASPAQTLTACYYEGTGTSFDAVGMSDTDMKDTTNYTGWDFSTLWNINPAVNGGYPYLDVRNASQESLYGDNISIYGAEISIYGGLL